MQSALRVAATSRWTRRVVVALLAAAALAACNGGGGGSTKDAGKSAAEVTMELVAFKPDRLEVSPGTKVTWTQKDSGFHTVTSGVVEQGGASVTQRPDGKFDSGNIDEGKTFSFTFEKAGTYPYFCSVHPATMRGEVSVR